MQVCTSSGSFDLVRVKGSETSARILATSSFVGVKMIINEFIF